MYYLETFLGSKAGEQIAVGLGEFLPWNDFALGRGQREMEAMQKVHHVFFLLRDAYE